jgi:hypothetical protein
MRDCFDDALMKSALARLIASIKLAIAKLEAFTAEIPLASAPAR